MPITELAALQLIQPHKFHSHHISELFRAVSARQSATSAFPLYYFKDTADKSIIYLISGWNDVDAHMKWIESDANQELLRLSAPYLKVIRLFHLDVDFIGAAVRGVTMVVVMKSGEEPIDKSEYAQDVPVWMGVGVDLESGSEETKYEVFAYDTKKVVATPSKRSGGPDHTMIMTRLALSEDN